MTQLPFLALQSNLYLGLHHLDEVQGTSEEWSEAYMDIR